MGDLDGQVALVTGASRGVGRGAAIGLAHAGAQVFATGRSIARAELDSAITALVCDHTDDEAVGDVFRQITEATGRLDILVNAAWGGYERMVENGKFTWALPFWEQPTWRWDAMIDAGVRAAYVRQSARRSHDGAGASRTHCSHLTLGGAEAPGQRLVRHCQGSDRQDDFGHGSGVEVARRHRRLALSRPRPDGGRPRRRRVRFEQLREPEFTGRAVAALAADPDSSRWSGSVVVGAALAEHYGFTDVDGRHPRPLTFADV